PQPAGRGALEPGLEVALPEVPDQAAVLQHAELVQRSLRERPSRGRIGCVGRQQLLAHCATLAPKATADSANAWCSALRQSGMAGRPAANHSVSDSTEYAGRGAGRGNLSVVVG